MKNRRYFCHASVHLRRRTGKKSGAETVISGKGISVRQRLII